MYSYALHSDKDKYLSARLTPMWFMLIIYHCHVAATKCIFMYPAPPSAIPDLPFLVKGRQHETKYTYNLRLYKIGTSIPFIKL